MTERKLYKKAYKYIFEEGHTHQEMYDLEHIESGLGPESVARTISMIPSQEKYASLKVFWMSYAGIIALNAILRLVVMAIDDQFNTMDITALIFAGLLVVLAPILAFYGSFKAKPTIFGLASVLILVGLIRGLWSTDLGEDTTKFAIIGCYIIAIILGSLIPRRLRVGYTKHVVDKEKDGKIVKRVTYSFDETKEMSRKEIFRENF